MHRTPVPPDKAPHPEAEENRRVGSQLFRGVMRQYDIEQDEVLLAGRRRTVDVLVGSVGIAHWYAPFVHVELPGELAKLRTADSRQILEFAATYGEMGFDHLQTDVEETLARIRAKKPISAGDPLPWLRAHASGVYMCLAITDALATKRGRAALTELLKQFDDELYGESDGLNRVHFRSREESPEVIARRLRREIINSNLRGITRYVSVDEKGKDRSFFGFSAPIEVVYWHLANLIDGGLVKRCEAEGCGGIFIQTDPRQRFCPKRWRQRESSCAMRQRQRRNPKRQRS